MHEVELAVKFVSRVCADVEEVKGPHLSGGCGLSTYPSPGFPVLSVYGQMAATMEGLGGGSLPAQADIVRVVLVSKLALLDGLLAKGTLLM